MGPRKYLRLLLKNSKGGSIVSSNLISFATPEKMQLQMANVSVTASQEASETIVRVNTDAVAMYVTLTTLAHGRFEDMLFCCIILAATFAFSLQSRKDRLTLQY